jgi:HTH-type transcriptional regulator, sugar sensing transcriptional regulator
MHIQSVIQQLGYRPHEVKVYLASLEMGESTVIELAQKTKLPRTSVQAIVLKLHNEGLLNVFLKKRVKHWVAENPEKLLIHLKEREAGLKNIMPELQAMRYETGLRPTVRLYSGKDEIMKIMDDILETKHHLTGILPWEEWVNFIGPEFIDDFINERSQRHLKIRLIVPRTASSAKLKATDNTKLRSTRFLKDSSAVKNASFIYANKTAIISLNKRLPLGIVIEDIDTAQTMTMLFENLWSQSAER